MEDEELARLTLKKVKIYARAVVGLEFLEDADLNIVSGLLSDEMVANISTFVWGNTVHKVTETYNHPATWWQGFKGTFFPQWLLRRYPVRMTDIFITTEFTHVCPHLKLAAKDPAHIQYLMPTEELKPE